MGEILGIALLIGALWLLSTGLDFIIAHWQIVLFAAVIIGLLPFIIGQKNSFFLLRSPVYVAGVVLCALLAPLDYAFLLFVEYIGAHALVGITRILGAPFAVISSAWFDRNTWPIYLKNWEKSHASIEPDWKRPARRFSELTKWLSNGS